MLSPNSFIELRDRYEPLKNSERTLVGSLAIMAISGTVLPLFFPYLPKEVKLLSNAWGLFGSVLFSVTCVAQERKEKTYASIEEANHVIVKETLKSDFAYQKVSREIIAKREMAAFVNTLPAEERGRWSQEYGLQGLVELPQIQQAVIEKPQEVPQLKMSFSGITQSQSSIDNISDDLAIPVDYTWMDADFINGSKVVYGPKGSGKSVYLAYEAIAFLTHFPDGELRIGDKHYDEEQSLWLPGIPSHVLLANYVAKKPEQMLNIFRRAKQLLDYRIEKGIKKNHPECKPFKFICDEFEGVMLALSDDEKAEVMSIITQTQDEGRKYQINLTLGTHSLKTKRIGIDSSVLFQMDVLCLGSALADSATRWPADIEAKTLLTQQMELQRSLKKSQGFACVVRKLGDLARVEVIPFLDITKFTFEYTATTETTAQETYENTQNWYDILLNWIAEIGRNPTDEELKIQWRKITNQELNDNGVKLLKERLDLN